jgi:hypothetical protein
MTEKNKIELTKIATILCLIRSDAIYNGQEGLALAKVKALNDLGARIEKVVESELEEKKI